MGKVSIKKDVHPKFEYELWRRPIIAHILQGESLRKKASLLDVMSRFKIKVDEYDKYVVDTESKREPK